MTDTVAIRAKLAGRVLRGLPRTDLLQMAGHLEHKPQCKSHFAVVLVVLAFLEV